MSETLANIDCTVQYAYLQIEASYFGLYQRPAASQLRVHHPAIRARQYSGLANNCTAAHSSTRTMAQHMRFSAEYRDFSDTCPDPLSSAGRLRRRPSPARLFMTKNYKRLNVFGRYNLVGNCANVHLFSDPKLAAPECPRN